MFLSNFILPLLFNTVVSKLLVDFNAAAGDDPSVLGLANLEGIRGVTQKVNTPDLFIDLGIDPNGIPAAHFHRDVGNIRTEYHSLNKKTEANTTYYIGYTFMLSQLQDNLMIWQLYVLFPFPTILSILYIQISHN